MNFNTHLQLSKSENSASWNYRTQEENLIMLSRLFYMNNVTSLGKENCINVNDFYCINCTTTSIRLQAHYTEELFIKLSSFHFLDTFYFFEDDDWYVSDSPVKAIINGYDVIFTVNITLTM